MTTFRVTETLLRGPFANDECFMAWLTSQPPAAAFYVSSQARAANNGGPDDRMFHTWGQVAQLNLPKCPKSDPTLLTVGGKNGWGTAAEAAKALAGTLANFAALDADVAKKNAAAVSPANIAASAAKDVAAAGAAAAGVVKDNAGTVAGGLLLTMGLYVGAIGLSGYVLWRLFGNAQRR